jgi:hypothetical protein
MLVLTGRAVPAGKWVETLVDAERERDRANALRRMPHNLI